MSQSVEDSPENDTMLVEDELDELQSSANDALDPRDTTALLTERDVSSSVLVAVRVRPLLAMEDGTDLCIRVMQSLPNDLKSLQVSGGGPRFTYDQVFDLT